MQKSLDSKTIGIILGVLAVVLVVAGVAYFKPQIGQGPPVVPVPYKRPGGAGYGPGAASGGGTGAPGAPIGAPAGTGGTSSVPPP